MNMPMGRRTAKVVVLGAFALAATPAFAGWRDVASAADTARFDHLDQTRALAMADARKGQSQDDWRIISQLMGPQGHAIPAEALQGNWRCRQIKLGGMSATMVYGAWFACEIRPVAGDLMLRKLDGSQRFAGRLFPENGAWVYLGASSARDEPGHDYSGTSPALGAQTTPDDQIGLLTGIGDNHLRLEIPAVQESLLDVVEFAR